ncbi:hypothetical protein ACJEIK_02780 [Mycobacterium sp. SMC-16]|uniref:hypothetical protein n=1 Tax=Mycobacteriaceae TaxID=1762 RepID=UPI001BB30429|nr:hypothetical protein [Mycolicibacterium sp. TY81]
MPARKAGLNVVLAEVHVAGVHELFAWQAVSISVNIDECRIHRQGSTLTPAAKPHHFFASR